MKRALLWSGAFFGFLLIMGLLADPPPPAPRPSVPQAEVKPTPVPLSGPPAFIYACSMALGYPLDVSMHADESFRIHWSNEPDGLVVTDEKSACGFQGWGEPPVVRWIRKASF